MDSKGIKKSSSSKHIKQVSIRKKLKYLHKWNALLNFHIRRIDTERLDKKYHEEYHEEIR
jgi:hypothetical protein